MPSKFPYLRSSTDPIGLIEQLGIAVTMNPDEDGAKLGSVSWFGRLLLKDGFKWIYMVGDKVAEEFDDRDKFAQAYFEKRLRYTAYDWETTFLHIDGGQGEVRGVVDIKGRCDICANQQDHLGRHQFRYIIVKAENGKWRVQQWILIKQEESDEFAPLTSRE